MSGACRGHRALLMYSMLEFAMLMGRYCRRERQLSKHRQVDPSDPRLTVETLVDDPEENECGAQMEAIFKGAMQLLGDPDRVLYAEPVSMAQHYDLMVAGSRHIGYLPDRPSRKTPEGVAELYLQERGELLKRIDGYLENRRIECGIVVPTCLRMPVLILEPRECMRRYHNPEQQGAFPTQFPIKGFGFVQPRNDLRRSIIPPNFRELPARVAAAMTTLIREDVLAADAADTEYHSTLRGLPPLLSSSQVTSTTTPRRDRRPSEGGDSTDTENARRMDDLSMEEAKCSLVREVLCCQGHSHLRCPPVRHTCCTPARRMCDDEDDQPSPRRSVSVADISVAEAKHNLESSWNQAPAPILPLMSILARPPMSSPRKDTSIADLTGRHLDASHQSRRDLAKWAPSPAEQEQSKKARTPSTEEEDETDEMVRHSQEQCQERQRSRPIARVIITDDERPGRGHELKQRKLQKPRPTPKRTPTFPPGMKTPDGKSSSAKPNARGNKPARMRRRSANSEAQRRQRRWKKS